MKIVTTVDLKVETLSNDDLVKISNAAAQEVRSRRVVRDTKDPVVKATYYHQLALNAGRIVAMHLYRSLEECGLVHAHAYIDSLMKPRGCCGDCCTMVDTLDIEK